jgi:5-methyltetrahydrofolate--homocysteine methyltransferase
LVFDKLTIDVQQLFKDLEELFSSRIAIIDGAMGTMVQTYKLQEEDYRGERFKDHKINLKNNNDVLNLTQPHIIKEIHKGYLDAGSDMIETNTFNGTPISLLDFDMADLAYEINKRAAEIAREATDQV